MLTFQQLRRANVKRCEAVFHPLSAWSPNDWATALAGEVGEACNLLKKLRRGEPVCAQAIGDELADVAIYLDLLAARLDLDLEHLIIRKFNRVSSERDCPILLPSGTAVTVGKAEC